MNLNNTLGFSVLIAVPFMCILSYLGLGLLKTWNLLIVNILLIDNLVALINVFVYNHVVNLT